MIQIVSEPIDPQQSYRLLQQRSAGSVLLHYAVVKADGGTGRTSCAVEYRAEPDAEAELEPDRRGPEGALAARRRAAAAAQRPAGGRRDHLPGGGLRRGERRQLRRLPDGAGDAEENEHDRQTGSLCMMPIRSGSTGTDSITLVEQNPYLFETSVYQNLAFGLRLRDVRSELQDRRIRQALEMVGLGGFEGAAPAPFPAAKAGAPHWPAPWCCGRNCCCSTSRPPGSTGRSCRSSKPAWPPCPGRGRPWSSPATTRTSPGTWPVKS